MLSVSLTSGHVVMRVNALTCFEEAQGYLIFLPFWRFFKGNLLSTLGPPPAKMQQRNFISKIPKKPPKPYEIHVPNSDQIFGDFSKEIC